MIIGSKIIFCQNLPSTNTYATQLLKNDNPPEGVIIYTNFQSAGKGQMGNKWESEDGKNLLVSIILFPAMINPEEQFILSMSISLGICDFLRRHIPLCSIKWPNDIYVNDDKIAGILIENSIMGHTIENTIAGIGLNINQEKFVSDAPNPTSLRLLTGREYDLAITLSQMAVDIDRRYKQLLSGKEAEIRSDYISLLYRLKEWHGFKKETGTFTGRIISVTGTGSLVVEDQQGVNHEFSFKEVEFIP